MQENKKRTRRGKWVVVHVNIPLDLAEELDALIQQEKTKVPHGKFDRSSVVTGAVREFVSRHLIFSEVEAFKEGTHNG